MKAKMIYPDTAIQSMGYKIEQLDNNLNYWTYVDLTNSNTRNTENTTSDYYSLNYNISGNLCCVGVSVDMASTASSKYTDYVVASGCPIPAGGNQSPSGLLVSNDGITACCFVRGNGDLVVASYDRNLADNHLHGNFFYFVDENYSK